MHGIEKQARRIVSDNIDLLVHIDQIENDDELTNYGMDSLSAMRIIIAIENEYGYEFPVDDLSMDTVKSISKITNYIKNKIINKGRD